MFFVLLLKATYFGFIKLITAQNQFPLFFVVNIFEKTKTVLSKTYFPPGSASASAINARLSVKA
jgi:hypothetical protein